MKNVIRLMFLPVILMAVLFFYSCEKEKNSGLPTDGDGNKYDTVAIGTQVWLKENLKTTKYYFGDEIKLITDNAKWITYSLGAYCWYDNNSNYKDSFGALYNWNAVKTGGLCPKGWHIPNEEEWTTLINYLGGESFAGAKLKEIGSQYWIAPDDEATNETGFSARGGGWRTNYDGTFKNLKSIGYSWALPAPSSTFDCFRIDIVYDLRGAYIHGANKESGFSVRCIKDN